MNTDSEHICFEQIEFAAVTDKGLSDVSILTMGEAGGHGMLVDEKTIEQFMQLSIGKTIPAYLTHAGAVDDSGRPKDRLGAEIGMFSGFYRDGNKVRAKNFQFLEAFKTAEPKTHATLLEMARNFADKLGISPVLRHAKAWLLGDGREVPAKDGQRPATALNKFPAMRLSGLLSCDFVQQPACNVSLFEAKVDPKPNTETTMTAETILLSKHTDEIAVLSTQHKDAVAALEIKHKEAVAALEAKHNEAIAQLAKIGEEVKSLTGALAAKTIEAETAAKYDMRKAGGEALAVALQAHGPQLPSPAKTDLGKWEQYHALLSTSPDQAEAFKTKYLIRK